MIKDFETVKKQLQELSAIVNSFKSEDVQLKIIELLFNGAITIDSKDRPLVKENNRSIPPTEKPQRRKAKKNSNGESAKKSSPRKRKLGPKSVLSLLLEEGFFKTKKTIGSIVEYSKNNLATTIKSNDLSGKLAVLVREKALKRERNPETNQYEYSNV